MVLEEIEHVTARSKAVAKLSKPYCGCKSKSGGACGCRKREKRCLSGCGYGAMCEHGLFKLARLSAPLQEENVDNENHYLHPAQDPL